MERKQFDGLSENKDVKVRRGVGGMQRRPRLGENSEVKPPGTTQRLGHMV